MPPDYKNPNRVFQESVKPTAAPLPTPASAPFQPTYSPSGGAIIPTVPISTPTAAPKPVTTPTLPEPQAPQVQQSYFTSLAEQAKQARTAVEDTYKSRLEGITKRIDESKTKIAELTDKQEVLLDTDIEPLLQPFRETLENSERERLYVSENFEANQALTRELEGLVSDANARLGAESNRFAPRSAIAAGFNKALNDITARAGLIQAAMSARTGQIGEAYRMIDRSVEAITADRKDQLSYYETLLNFYENEKDSEGKRLITLESDERDFLNAQVGLLEKDLTSAQQNADALKEAMLDPDLAQTYAQAGVTLNDSPEQITKKLGDYAYQREVQSLSNEMAQNDYAFLAPGQSAPAGAHVVTVADSKGNERRYYAKLAPGTGTPAPIGPDGEPLQFGTADYVVGRLRATAGSKTKPVASEREQLGKFANVVALTEGLMGSLSNTVNDPLLGYLKSLNPYDFDARAVNAQVTALVPSVARGLYGEVGVLTDTDIERYLKTLPNLRSTADQNKFVALMTLTNAMRSYEQTLLNLANSNVNVSGFVDSYENMANTVKKLEEDLNVGEPEVASEDEAAWDEVVGTEKPGNYFSRLWNAILGQ